MKLNFFIGYSTERNCLSFNLLIFLSYTVDGETIREEEMLKDTR